MHSIRRFFAIIIGLIFIVSGFVKLIDPVGTGLIVAEYLKLVHFDWMLQAAKLIGTVLAITECLLAVALLTGVWRRFTGIFTSSIVALFTLVTVFLAVFNPSMECGCFGEFIHLSHYETLIKNLVLCVLCMIAFIPVWDLGITDRRKYVAFGIDALAICAICIYSWHAVPYFDFTDYKTSQTIRPENAVDASDVTTTLALWDIDGEDMSEAILDGNVALISIYHPEDLKDDDIMKLSRFASDAFDSGFTPFVIATESVDIPGVECFLADYKSIITLNRSNGGVTLLEDGFISGKCSINFLYSPEDLRQADELSSAAYYVQNSSLKSICFQAAALLFFCIALL